VTSSRKSGSSSAWGAGGTPSLRSAVSCSVSCPASEPWSGRYWTVQTTAAGRLSPRSEHPPAAAASTPIPAVCRTQGLIRLILPSTTPRVSDFTPMDDGGVHLGAWTRRSRTHRVPEAAWAPVDEDDHVRRTIPASADETFALLADLRGHHRWIPLTTTDAPPPPARPGDALTALTAGVLPDRMRVEHVRPPSVDGGPGVLGVRKLGPVLLGDVEITVTPAGPGASVVDWREDVWLRGPLPRRLTRLLLTPPLEAMTALALRRVERHLDVAGDH
jgi:hypothetical protein